MNKAQPIDPVARAHHETLEGFAVIQAALIKQTVETARQNDEPSLQVIELN